MSEAQPEVRYFEWRNVEAAAAHAQAGGIAVHRNFDVDGLVIGGKQRSGCAFHVLAKSKDALVTWGRSYGQREDWLQRPRTRGLFEGLWHYDVFGAPGRRLLRESGQDDV